MAAFDVEKAIKNNTVYANTTKPPWRDRFYQVCEQLGILYQTPTPALLAEGIYKWQLKQPGMTADGMLGPKGWENTRTTYSLQYRFQRTSRMDIRMPPGWQPSTSAPKPIKNELNGITDLLDQRIADNPSYENTLVNSSVFVASLTLGNMKKLGKLGGFAASAVVQPLVWAYQGNTGDDWDKILFGLGLLPPFTIAAGIMGIWKGIIDDNIRQKLEQVHASEPSYLSNAILPASTYGGSGPGINAQTIASRGGVAWQHPNGLWVYIKLEKNGKDILVCD